MFFKDCCNNITEIEHLCCDEIPIISTVCFPDHIDIYVSVDCPGFTYKIQKKLSSQPPGAWVDLDDVDIQPYSDYALINSTDYDYRVEVSGPNCAKVYSYEVTRQLCSPPCCTKKPNISYETWYQAGNVYISFTLTEGDCQTYKIYKYGMLGWEFFSNITTSSSVLDFVPLSFTDPVTCINESYKVVGTGTNCIEQSSTPIDICYTLCCDPDYTLVISNNTLGGNGILINIFKILDTPCYNCIKIYKRIQGEVIWNLFIESDEDVFWFFDYDVVDGVTYEYYAEWNCQNGSLAPECVGCECLTVKSNVFTFLYNIPPCCDLPYPTLNITEYADHLHIEIDNVDCQNYVYFYLYRKIVGGPVYTFLTPLTIPYIYDDYSINPGTNYEYKLEIFNNIESCEKIIVTEQIQTSCTPTIEMINCSGSVKKGNWFIKPNALIINMLVTIPNCCVNRDLLVSPGPHNNNSQSPSNPLPVGTTLVSINCDVIGGPCFTTPGYCNYDLDINICGKDYSWNCTILVTN